MKSANVHIRPFLFICLFCVTRSDHNIDDGLRELCDVSNAGKYRCDCPQGTNATETVDCSNRDLTDMSQFISFKDIRRVDFSNNRIASVLQNTFVEGRDVNVLDLSHNVIDFIQHSVFTRLESLEKLVLSHNQIWNLDVNLLDGLHSLVSLDLSYNRIMSWDPDLFKPCRQLKQLDLSYNWIGSSGLDFGGRSAFEHLAQLESLNLANTGLTRLPLDIFASNQKLKSLYLNGNPLKTVPNAALQSAPVLSLLDLSATNLQVIQYQDFSGLKSLRELRLERIASLVRIEMNAFGDLHNLSSLVCRHNYRLSEIHSKAFANNQTAETWRLVNLILRHNSLQTLAEDMILWKSLHIIDLEGNPFRCDCHIKWMAQIGIGGQLKQTKCSQPAPLSGQLIKSLSATDFVCRNAFNDSFLVAVTTLIFLATLVLMITAFLTIRLKWCANGCYIPFRKSRLNYVKVVVSKERVDLEWDDSADP